ncbi:MAG: deoxyribonuclease V [Thermodesulfovibrionales bacterium]|nr:deoxyribonuclease V [Thermodesulfovibrionales bacterium]
MKWPKDIKRARVIQEILKKKVRITPFKKPPEYITGVDAAFLQGKVIGAACLYKYPDIILIEETYVVTEVLFPYIPGLLSFREGPAIIKAINKLKVKPDVILFDGHGIAHPKGLGIAAHIGVLLDAATIGCAKSRLIGKYREPGPKKGDWSLLRYNGKILGAVLRTKDNVRPLFVSPGNKIDLRGSIEIVLACTRRYRIPEPLRRADFISKKIKRELLTC